MEIFNHILLGKLIEEQYSNNKNFAKELNKRGLKKGEDSIKKWRQGNSVPKILELPTIANALSINVNDFFFGFETSQIIKKELLNNHILDKILIKKFNEKSEDIYIPTNLIKNFNPNYLRVYKVNNIALEPKFSLDDNLLIDLIENRKFKRKNGIYVVENKGDTFIKYVKFLEDEEMKFYNLDKSEPTNASKEDKIIAKVCDKIISNYEGLED